MNTIARNEFAHTILGVEGRMMNAVLGTNGLLVNQTWVTSRTRGNEKCVVEMRFDDQCKNGHQTFSVTGTLYEHSRDKWRDVVGGQIREDIARFFPELTPLMQWHLTSTDGPMHYVANAVYLAGDRDCWGLRKGEQRQMRTGEGKDREFDAARRVAVWPEATDDELTVAPEVLTAALMARLPGLLAAFHVDMVDVCGFLWREVAP